MNGARARLHALHRASAMVIGAFAVVHLANHLVSLGGVDAHIAFMNAARHIYRQPIVETVLLACVAFQIGSGSWFVVRGRKQRRGPIAWLQAASGLLLALFLLVHVGAVLFGRAALGLDTNFYFAAAGFFVPPNQYFFAPYYFLAVVALFVHPACAIWWQARSKAPRPNASLPPATLIAIPAVVGAIVALVIVLSLAGRLQPVEIPAKYLEPYGSTPTAQEQR